MLAEGMDTAAVCGALGVSEGTYHRGRKPVRRAQAEDARWLMELERENLHAHAVSGRCGVGEAALNKFATSGLMFLGLKPASLGDVGPRARDHIGNANVSLPPLWEPIEDREDEHIGCLDELSTRASAMIEEPLRGN